MNETGKSTSILQLFSLLLLLLCFQNRNLQSTIWCKFWWNF